MNRWTDIARATNAQLLAWAEGQPWVRAMAACQQDAQCHAESDQKLPLFPGELQNSLANRRRDPNLGLLFQLVEQRAHLWHQSRSLGLEKDAKDSNRFDSQLHRDLMATAFVHQQRVGVDFEDERQRGGFARIKIGGANGGRDGGRLLSPNPGGQGQPLKARSLTCQTIKLGGDFQRKGVSS